MSNHPPIPRLSIVVAIGPDLAAFERTLISVLENRPVGCEVLISHDGTYDDPFDLCDEVRFAVAKSNHLVDLIAAGADESRGRFVHVLSDGIEATPGWVDAALEKFEHFDAGAVAPVIRHRGTNRIVAAGWSDSSARLCTSTCRGLEEVEPKSATGIGAYLQASFWRRDLIRSMCQACTISPSVEAAYTYEHLVREAGWRSVLAAECDVLSESTTLPWDSTSLGRGAALRAIRNHFNRSGWLRSISAATHSLLRNLPHPRLAAESIGQAVAPLARRRLAQQIRGAKVTRCDDQQVVVRLPNQDNIKTRRAA